MGSGRDAQLKSLLVGLVIAAVGLTAGIVTRSLTNSTDTAAVAAVSASARDCPDGSVLATYAPGSRIYAIGRTESSDWVQVRALSSPDHNVWVRATHIEFDANIADLPVTDCATFDGVVAIGDTPADSSTTTTLGVTTTTVDASTTTTTTNPTTPTTTAPPTTTTLPDTTPPQISQPSAKPAEIWEEDGLGISCPEGTNRQSTISAVATDNLGVTSVTASWTDPLGNFNIAMSRAGSTYTTTFGPYTAGDWDPLSVDPYDHSVTITITASDAAGNDSSTTVSVTVWEIGDCFG